MKKQRGMAVPIALLLSVMFLMFAVMVMTVQNSTRKFTKKLNVELKAHYLALGGVQHTLLKIKELREYFYDALKWGYHVGTGTGSGAAAFVMHVSPHANYLHPITRVPVVVGQNAQDRTEAMQYLDYFKCDIFSYSFYSTIENSYLAGVQPISSGANITPNGDSVKINLLITDLGYDKTGPNGNGGVGWVSSEIYGDPFNGEYHMGNLGNDQTDCLQQGFSTGNNGIAEIISNGGLKTIQGNKAASLATSWIRKGGTMSTIAGLREEGLVRFSTRIIQTGDPNDTSDDTEEDSIQVIIIGIERPSITTYCEKSSTTRGSGTQIVKLKKIEKIERRIGS